MTYIRREAAIRAHCDGCVDDGYCGKLDGRYACDDVPQIMAIPAADVRPVVVAHWEWDENGMDWNLGAWRCSHCRCKAETWWATDKHNPLRCAGSHFCGNCGADMRGLRNE